MGITFRAHRIESNLRDPSHSLRMTILQRFNESRISFRHRLTRRSGEIFSHPIENPVYKTARFRAAKSFCQLDPFVYRDDWRDIVAIKHLVDREPEDIAIHRGDAPEFVILTVAPDALVDLRKMRHHSFDERLRKLAHARLGRAKLPEIVDLLRAFATLEVAPEMILNCRFTGPSPFTHGPSAVWKPPLLVCCEAPIAHSQFRPPLAQP